MTSGADDTASFASKKTTSPAVMFISRLVLHRAMTWTEKSACVANLPHLHKLTRALPVACCCYYGVVAVLRLVMVLLLLQLHTALSSLVTCNEKTKEKKNVSKESKELREGSPTNNFLVGNYGRRKAES